MSNNVTKSNTKLPNNLLAFHLLKEEGLNTAEAAKTLNYNPIYGYELEKKLNKYSLKSSKMVKSAHEAVKNLVQGKGVGTVEKVKDSTVLAAAQMIYDRAEPVVKAQDQGQSVNFVQVNINMIDNRTPQDIVCNPPKNSHNLDNSEDDCD